MSLYSNSNEIIKDFTSSKQNKKVDYLKHENSNFIYGLPLLRHNIDNLEESKYLLNNILDKELVDLYNNGVIYIHDKKLSTYCCSISCKDIALKGIPTTAKNMLVSKPTKRFSKLIRHFSNIVTLMSQQCSGAVMLSQMTTVLASYLYETVIKEFPRKIVFDDIYNYIYQDVESLIWELNMPLRSGSQSPFSNITLEFGSSADEIAEEYVVYGGEIQNYKYSQIPSIYFDVINKVIIDIMSKGNNNMPFTFPLLTVQITDDFPFNDEMFLYFLENLYNFGGAYFENFRSKPFNNPHYKLLNPRLKAKDSKVSRSMCCRLNIDLSILSKLGGGIFGNSIGNTGAVQVLNLNLNRIFLEASLLKDKQDKYNYIYDRIEYILEVMQKGHQDKRQWILDNKNLFPTFFSFNKDLKNYFNVFAVTGMHEGLVNFGFEGGITNTEGKLLAHQVMQFISNIIDHFIVRDNVACGIEYAPSENAGIKMARDDVKYAKKYNLKCFVQGKGHNVWLTTGCSTPTNEPNQLLQIENSSEFQGYATSGSILHHFIETKIENKVLAKYLNKLFNKPINYITFTPTLTVCGNCNTRFKALDGIELNKCNSCGSDDLLVFSRVIGYLKPIARKNIKDNKIYGGKFNFWSEPRRLDWSQRNRFTRKELNKINDEI